MQMTLFDYTRYPFKVDKPIRLITLFAGVGAASMALNRLGVEYENYFAVEWDEYAIKQYNAIHGTDYPTRDIQNVHGEDLKIVDKDKYFYLLQLSPPCTSVSLAGRREGMVEGSGTASSMLWECKRIIDELEELPDAIVMENVPAIRDDTNVKEFRRYCEFLDSKGYVNYAEDLNAKNYGVAQNRDRCFMVSLLGDYAYHFQTGMSLRACMGDYLEDDVDEKFFLRSEKANNLIKQLIEVGDIPNISSDRQTDRQTRWTADKSIKNPRVREQCNGITRREDRGIAGVAQEGMCVVELHQS